MTWVPPGHFYSPIVDAYDPVVQEAMRLEAQPEVPPETFGVSADGMLRWFGLMCRHYETNPFPAHKAEDRLYHYENPNFPLADAIALMTVMLEKRPRRLVEIGSGFSTCAAIDISETHLGGDVQMAMIDPNPELVLGLLGEESRYSDRIVRKKLQEVPLGLFRELQRRDILFIDSSHVAKTGSDVLDYVFRILPALAPGVVVHIHDIFYPFEYPEMWIVEQNRSWNEAYLVRAFLEGNHRFRILFFTDWFYKCRRDLVTASMPLCIEHRGGSLWLESI